MLTFFRTPCIFENWSGKLIDVNTNNAIPSTPDSVSQNLKSMHTIAVSECLKSNKPNPILAQPASNTNLSEQSLSRKTRRILAQLHAGNSPILVAYMCAIDFKSCPSITCKSRDHTTQNLFFSSKISIILTARDLWDDPVAVAALLQKLGGYPGIS